MFIKNIVRTLVTSLILVAASLTAFAQFPWGPQVSGPVKKVDVAVIKKDVNGLPYFSGETETIGLYGTANQADALNELMFSYGMCLSGTPAEQAACNQAVAKFTGTFVLGRNSNTTIKPVNANRKIAEIWFSFHFMKGVPEAMFTIDKVTGVRTNLNVINFSAVQMSSDGAWGMEVNDEYFWGTQMFNKVLSPSMYTYGTLPLGQPITAGQSFWMNPNHDGLTPTSYQHPVAFQTAMCVADTSSDPSASIALAAKVGGGPYASPMKVHIHGIRFAD